MDVQPVSEHRLRRLVQFYETDAAAIVHFSWFYRYMEEAEHAMWTRAGLSKAPTDATIGWPRVAASFDFHRALRYEDEFDIWLGVAALGRRTVRYACVVSRQEERIATGDLTIACVEMRPDRSMKAIPIPAEIAARFAVSPEAVRVLDQRREERPA